MYLCCLISVVLCVIFFFQAEDGIRDLVRSRGLGDVYKRQVQIEPGSVGVEKGVAPGLQCQQEERVEGVEQLCRCLLYTSDAADDLLCVDLGGRRIIKKKNKHNKNNDTIYNRGKQWTSR